MKLSTTQAKAYAENLNETRKADNKKAITAFTKTSPFQAWVKHDLDIARKVHKLQSQINALQDGAFINTHDINYGNPPTRTMIARAMKNTKKVQLAVGKKKVYDSWGPQGIQALINAVIVASIDAKDLEQLQKAMQKIA